MGSALRVAYVAQARQQGIAPVPQLTFGWPHKMPDCPASMLLERAVCILWAQYEAADKCCCWHPKKAQTWQARTSF
jgi:hypothetical protein